MPVMSASHLSAPTNPYQRNIVIERISTFLKDKDFTAFAGLGVSGLTVASMLSFVMNKGLVIIRKQSDRHHASPYDIEGLDGTGNVVNKVLIVDDLIASGNTMRQAIESLNNFCNKWRMKVDIKGIVLYHGHENDVGDEYMDIPVIFACDYNTP